MDNSGPNTSPAVRSTEFCRSLFDERDIGIRFRNGSGDRVIKPARPKLSSNLPLLIPS